MAASITHRFTTILFALGVVQGLLIGSFAWFPDISLPLPRLLLIGVALMVYLAAGVLTTRYQRFDDHTIIRMIWGIGLAMRVMVIPVTPELSDDLYRYMWDGHVQYSGVNPYVYGPADPALESIRTPWHQEINHPEVPTIYPPFAQLLFLGIWVFGGTVLAVKLLWICFDIGTAWILVQIARSLERPLIPILVWYVWSPLLVVEVAWNGHYDIVGVFWLTLFLWLAVLLDRGHPTLRKILRWRAGLLGTCLAAATMTKLAPVLLLPAFWQRYGKVFVGAFLAVCALLYLPYASIGFELLTKGLRIYLKEWVANPGAFLIIQEIIKDPMVSRILSGIIVIGTILLTMIRRFGPEDTMMFILGAGILFSPTIHPWYVIWLLPFAALRGNSSFLTLSGCIFFGYWGLGEYQRSGVWPQPSWVLLAIWLPVWTLLGFQLYKKGLPPTYPQEGQGVENTFR